MNSVFLKQNKFNYKDIEFELTSISEWGEGVNEIYGWSEEYDGVYFFEVNGTIYWVCDDELINVIKDNDEVDTGSVLESIIRSREEELEFIKSNGGYNTFGEKADDFISNPINHPIVDFKDGNPNNCKVDNLYVRY